MQFSLTFLYLFTLCVPAVDAVQNWTQLQWNGDDRLEFNWVLHRFSERSHCGSFLEHISSLLSEQRADPMTSAIDNDLTEGTDAHESADYCVAVCLQKGVRRVDVAHIPATMKYVVESADFDPSTFKQWISECQRVELGIISYLSNPLLVYYIDNDSSRHHVATVTYGERQTIWISTFLGHRFDIINGDTNELLQTITMTHSTFLRFGEHAASVQEDDVSIDDIRLTLHNEVKRSQRVRRTFTSTGFSKGRLPPDLWASIDTYYYNNRQAFGSLEWAGKGYYVNWWEVSVHFLGIPPHLKKYWQSRLKDHVEHWIGDIPLENTDIYGIRRYLDGARLLTHVDREATHAVSLIINIAQGNMREPWKLEIYDFEGRLHEVAMDPGDIVFYESARCLHGRMRPLHGGYYDNLFSHYRPVGDPEWFTRDNPDLVHESIDSSCELSEAGECIDLLAQDNNDVVKTGEDLFTYWRKVTPVGGFGDEFRL